MNKKILLLLPLLVILFLLVWLVGSRKIQPLFSGKLSGAYQSVTLANGAVYFGKIQSLNGNILVLTDIFYLRAVQRPTGTPSAAQNQMELVKLGNELHGPTDRMTITHRQVLAVQDLRPDSKVVAAINEYYRNQKGR